MAENPSAFVMGRWRTMALEASGGPDTVGDGHGNGSRARRCDAVPSAG